MKVTFILKGKTDEFFNGFGDSIKGLLNMNDSEKFSYLNRNRNEYGFSMKIGAGDFRDAVELNQLLRQPVSMEFRLEPRKGYRLATFDIRKV